MWCKVLSFYNLTFTIAHKVQHYWTIKCNTYCILLLTIDTNTDVHRLTDMCTERQRDRQTCTHTHEDTDTHTWTQTHKHMHRHTHAQTQTDTDTQWHRHTHIRNKKTKMDTKSYNLVPRDSSKECQQSSSRTTCTYHHTHTCTNIAEPAHTTTHIHVQI